jgi:DNA topoisomerase-1
MELVLAEKPKVAEKIAKALGEEGNIVRKAYNGVSYYETTHGGIELVIAPAVGHIYTLVEKEKSHTYPVFDIEWVPAYRASKKADYTKQYVELIQKLAKKADTFVSACDYDIEGSTIAYNVFRFATTIREGRRMKFSALTNEDIISAYENSSDFDYNNAYAGETRHILDWYYGINLSRALMSAMRAASRYRVLSIGRVQGPALEVICRLERDIRAFVPTPYWELSAIIKGSEFLHMQGRFLEENDAKSAMDRTRDNGSVKAIEKKEQAIQPNPNFDLTSLQVEAYRLFKFSPSRTLELAQTLYEASLITYPRTSSQKIPASINLQSILQALSTHHEYASLTKTIMSNKWTKPVQGKKDDPAHPAIHPTGQKGKIDGAETQLYDLIVRRFLAAFAPEAKKARVRIIVESGGEQYSASGSRIVEKGWIEFYGPHYTSEDIELPQFSEGEKVSLEDRKKTKKETKPPKRYTQASLVSELEDRHLGTKATRSVIVDTLFKRGYVDGKSLEVSDFGLKVCDVLEKYAPEILDEQLTRKLEDEMEGIQDGKVEKEKVILEGKEILSNILSKWKTNEAKIGKELLEALRVTEQQESILGPCDKCGKMLRIIHMKDKRQFIGCYGYPACRNTYPLPYGALVKPANRSCPDCSKPMVSVKKGRTHYTMCVDPNCPSKARWRKSVETAGASSGAATNPKTESGPSEPPGSE